MKKTELDAIIKEFHSLKEELRSWQIDFRKKRWVKPRDKDIKNSIYINKRYSYYGFIRNILVREGVSIQKLLEEKTLPIEEPLCWRTHRQIKKEVARLKIYIERHKLRHPKKKNRLMTLFNNGVRKYNPNKNIMCDIVEEETFDSILKSITLPS